MHESLKLTIAYAFDELNLHRVMANYAPTNVKSGRVLRRLGFRIEGYAERYLMINGVWTDQRAADLELPSLRSRTHSTNLSSAARSTLPAGREEVLGCLGAAREGQPPSKRILGLERELRRKEKALPEAAALLVLRTKVGRRGALALREPRWCPPYTCYPNTGSRPADAGPARPSDALLFVGAPVEGSGSRRRWSRGSVWCPVGRTQQFVLDLLWDKKPIDSPT